MKRFIRLFSVVLSAVTVVLYTLIIIGASSLPNEATSYSNTDIKWKGIYYADFNQNSQVDYQGNQPVNAVESEIKLFGIIPVKSTQVIRQEQKSVIVSGESFGIKLYTDGVIVVGTRDVDTAQGKQNPASIAGLEKGDIIVSINGKKTYSSNQVEEAFNDNNGRTYRVKIKRNGNYKSLNLEPAYSPAEGKYKVGIWVRDSTAGIGTITFYNQENNSLAALGHPITDVDTNDIMPILKGEAVKTTVTKLYKSKNGEAGSLCCDFSNDVIGTLTKNSNCGIYGKYVCSVDLSKQYKVALAQDIKKGSAQLICTVDENGPNIYDVEITRVSYKSNGEKNLVIKVVDERLLEKTGGIVQGMSGSPIIQDGMLVGALTHVVVDNPQKGYGIFAEKMIKMSMYVE